VKIIALIMSAGTAMLQASNMAYKKKAARAPYGTHQMVEAERLEILDVHVDE
jgi:hypothetical protein